MYRYPCVQKIEQIQLPACMYHMNPITLIKQVNTVTPMASSESNCGNSYDKCCLYSDSVLDERKMLSMLAKQEKLIQRILQLEKQVNSLVPAAFGHEQSNGEPTSGPVTEATTRSAITDTIGSITSSKSLADAGDAVSVCPVYPKVVKGILDRQEKLIQSIDQLTQQIEKRVNLSSSNSGTIASSSAQSSTERTAVHSSDHKLATGAQHSAPQAAPPVPSIKQRLLDIAIHVGLDDASDLIPVHKFLEHLSSLGFQILLEAHLLHSGGKDGKIKPPSLSQWTMSSCRAKSRSDYDLTVSVIFHRAAPSESSTFDVRAVINPSCTCTVGSKGIIAAIARALKVNAL